METASRPPTGGRVAVEQALKQGPAVGSSLPLRQRGDPFAVALDREPGQAAFRIGLGIPGERVAGDLQARGGGGGVVSVTAVFLTYSSQARATRSVGSYPTASGSP
ncbi:MAG: hypothetical protein O3A37_01115, partial [Planctomycetota bacterium]|nr:hypothetical protein [Planctomycetota bacterium]